MQITDDFINKLEVSNQQIVDKISIELEIQFKKVNAAVKLLKEDNTIPFISRYRKEATGSLDEIEVRNIYHRMISLENLENRRIDIIRLIHAQGKLTDELYNNIMKANTLAELEDLYAPYKKKKKTRGMLAIEKGLEELADIIEKENDEIIEKEAERFISEEKGVNNIDEAIGGAKDIIAERIAHNPENRKIIKKYILEKGLLIIKGLKEEESSVYKMYYDFKEPLSAVKPHRILAINRGEKEEELEVQIDFENEECSNEFLNNFALNSSYYKDAILDGLTRLLLPAVIREIRSDNTESADEHGISVFSKNLSNLLMQPPIKKTRVLGVDPGIRTGTKAAALDATGKFLGYFTFFQEKTDVSKKAIYENLTKYNIELIAVGNGTGTHDVQRIISETIKDYNLQIKYTVVSEDGASVYSASKIAGEEFPDIDLTIRGAISIARRLQDPLSEFVKIDPRSIGVGLYQHDVNQTKLSETLDETVESVVNKVGVNLNTASFSLLKYISGITSSIAKKIVNFREENGIIKSRQILKEIPGVGEKSYVQAAGFLKIPESNDPLDNTWVHPENYEIARKIYDIIKINKEINKSNKENLMNEYQIGETTINDIIEELKKPNRDPREDYPKPILQDGVVTFEDLKVGMTVTGKIKNVVDFGAFVDIGIKESALLHVSEISNRFIKNPIEVLKVGDVKQFEIINIDEVRKRISVSLKKLEKPIQQKRRSFDYSQYMIE